MAIYIGTKRIDGGGSSDPSTLKLNFNYVNPVLVTDDSSYKYDLTNSILSKVDNSTNLYDAVKIKNTSKAYYFDNNSTEVLKFFNDNEVLGLGTVTYGNNEYSHDEQNFIGSAIYFNYKYPNYYTTKYGGYFAVRSRFSSVQSDSNLINQNNFDHFYIFTGNNYDDMDSIPSIACYSKSTIDASNPTIIGNICPLILGYWTGEYYSGTSAVYKNSPIINYAGNLKPLYYRSSDDCYTMELAPNSILNLTSLDSSILNKKFKFNVLGYSDYQYSNEFFKYDSGKAGIATITIPAYTSVEFTGASWTEIKYAKGYNDIISDSSSDIMIYSILYDASTAYINRNIYS